MSLYKKLVPLFLLLSVAVYAQKKDSRDVFSGTLIYNNSYIDQPYVVKLKDGSWLCVFTTGAESESRPGQHIVSIITKDQGKTWSNPIKIEPNVGPISSWAIPYLTSYGRIYVFYNYNGDNVAKLNGKPIRQAGLLGWYCYKYSDDNGQTWSEKRYRLPVRLTDVDTNNDFKGKVQMLWGIDKPHEIDGVLYFAFTKLGVFPQGMGEGWMFKSDNIAHEKDPEKHTWTMLPEGNKGFRNPELGSVQEEHNIVQLNNGTFYCVLRTALGFTADSYSFDKGTTWTVPQPMTYLPDETSLIKNPRACPRIFKCTNGKYLLWYHNHGGKDFKGRNPVWVTGGIEKDGKIHWSQPEILLYTTDPKIAGMSYPDLIEQDGKYWITETQKKEARVHVIDNNLLEGLWKQAERAALVKNGLLFNKSNIQRNNKFKLKQLPGLKDGGFTVEMWLSFKDLKEGLEIVDTRGVSGKGLLITTKSKHSVNLQLNDGETVHHWDTDADLLTKDKLHHIVFIVDGLSDVISVIIDGKLCDGGKSRQQGWSKFSDKLDNINGDGNIKLASSFNGEIKQLRIYSRYLTTSEVISNYNSGIKKGK